MYSLQICKVLFRPLFANGAISNQILEEMDFDPATYNKLHNQTLSEIHQLGLEIPEIRDESDLRGENAFSAVTEVF
jgi:hypothetical protein